MIRDINLKIFALFFLTMAIKFSLHGQDINTSDPDTIPKVKLLEMSFDIVQPLADFQRKLDGSPIGFSTRYYWQPIANRPVFLGVEANYAQLFSIAEDYTDFIDGFQIDLTQTVKSHMLGTHFIFRYYPSIQIPFVQPYLEGLAGTKVVFASNVIRDIETGESLQFNFRDGGVAISYGMAAGFQIDIKDGNWYLNGRFSYELGTSSSFLGLDPIDSQRIFDLQTRNAAFHMIRYQIGFSFAF